MQISNLILRYGRGVLFACLLAVCCVLPISGIAQDADGDVKTLLVLNSNDEAEPWANDLTQPIVNYISNINDVECEIVYLNNVVTTDSTSFFRLSDKLFEQYANNPPSYVVMVGDFAFMLRERVKEEWGDIPILLLSRVPYFSRLDYYLNEIPLDSITEHTPLSEVRSDYNFTTIVIPDNFDRTVDLMLNMNPDMEKFMFFSSDIFVAREIASGIKGKLKREKPQIDFHWVKASEENAELLRNYLTIREPKRGLLVSSWCYEKTDLWGHPLLTSVDLRLIASSKNPIYSLREAYRFFGCIGGVYCDNSWVHATIVDMLNRMLGGESMREIPFAFADSAITQINYRLLQTYKMSENTCPQGTHFIVKPESYLEKYFWQLLVGLLVVLIVLIVMAWQITIQRKRIQTLNYNAFFIKNMPIPFSKATILFDNFGNVKSISYTMKNQKFEEMIGKNKMDDTQFLLFPVAFISEQVSRLINNKEDVISFPYYFEKTDESYEFILCSLQDKVHNSSQMKRVDMFALDVTEMKRSERIQTHAKHVLDLTIEVTNLVPWQWDLQKDLITFDDRNVITHLHSHQVKDLYIEQWESTFDDFLLRLHEDDQPKFLRLREDMNNSVGDGHFLLTVRMNVKGGVADDWVEIEGSVTDRTVDNKFMVVTGSLRVVSEKKRAEKLMLDALNKAKESDRMKSAFLANMSHEIRTPLNAIVGFSNLITEVDDEEEREAYKKIININNEQLLCLIDDVLDLAKIESGTVKLNKSEINVNEVMTAAMRTVKLRMQKGVTFNLELGCDSCIIEGDFNRLLQILNNLLTNACKFTMQGSITMGYELRNNKKLYFYVKDTGIGISEEGKKVIFDRFVKLNDFAQGSGLGLAITHRLVELMGGTIGIESEGENKGSCFWFELPYTPMNASDEVVVPERKRKTLELPVEVVEQNAPSDGTKRTILVAEDTDSNYMLISSILRKKFNLIRAKNGHEAVELFKKHKPELILMDIGMPVMNGYEATECIRTISEDVPIIAVTAYAYDSDRKRILSCGFDDYLAKPLSPNTLFAAIEKALN